MATSVTIPDAPVTIAEMRMKHDHRMDRCHLKGEAGDRIHAVLCAAGYNIRWLLRMIVKKGLGPFLCLVFGSLYNAMRRLLEHGRVLFGASDRRFAVGAA